MSYRAERERFVVRMTQEGLPLEVTRLLLREATGLQRRAELACSSEAADRDRVACPAAWSDHAPKRRKARPCLCDFDRATNQHTTVPRIAVQDWRAEARVRKALAAVEKPGDHQASGSWSMVTEGDPRGAVLKVIPPSYAARNAGKDRHNLEAIGVPAGPSRLRF